MRNSREEAADNRARVIVEASRLFREHGYDGVGVATLMKAAGLTNGAFYKQFRSKEDLVAEATAQALSENTASWNEVLENDKDDPMAAVTRWYLDDKHLSRRRDGCTFAALAGDAPRHDKPVREAFETGVSGTIDRIAVAMDPMDPAAATPAAARFLCQLVGALTLARAVSDPKLAQAILDAARTSK